MTRTRRRTSLVTLLLTLAVWSSPAQTPTLSFAWLSDTHVGGESGSDDLRAAVRDINAIARRTPELQFVILSGDITEYGSDAQLQEAHQILDSLAIPLHAIPGNHDTKWSASGGTTFSRLWGSDRFVFGFGGFRFIGMHQGPRMKMADGHWAPEDLRWLDTTLAAVGSGAEPVIFVSHYPIDSSIANWYEVLERLRPFNVQAILVGHGHRRQLESFEGFPAIMNRSTLRGKASRGGYSLCRIERDTLFVDDRRVGEPTAPAVLALPLRRTSTLQVAPPHSRPDFSVNTRYPRVRREWSFSTGYTIASSPAVADDRVFVGDASGRMQAIELSSGMLLWTMRTGGPIYSTPAVSGSRVVFGSTDSTIYCLNTSNGRPLWDHKTHGPIVASPLIDGTSVYIGSSDGSFRALDLETGAEQWAFDGVEGFVECRPLLAHRTVYFGAWDGCFYALDCSTGTLRWKWVGETRGILYSPAACWPVAASGRVFVVAPDRKMTAFDAESGRVIWRSADHQVRESIGLSSDGERVYVRTMRDSIIALSTRADRPVTVWTSVPALGYDINSSMLVERDGVLYYPSKNGFLYALSAHSGALLWIHRLSPGAVHTPTPVRGRRVVTADFDGRVTLLQHD